MITKLHARQVLSRDLLQRLAPYASTQELDNLLRSIDFEITPILELKATSTPSLTVNIGSSIVENLETGYKKAAPAIKLGIPSLTSGSIVLPAAHNGLITVTPGLDINLNCPNDQFATLLVSITKTNEILLINGAPQVSALAAIANAPKSKSGTLAIGILLVRNVGGTIQPIAPSDIYQFGSGAGGGGGEVEIDVVLGEDLSLNDPVYISQGALDGGRTAARAYLLDNTDDNRMEFIGFMTEDGLAGETKSVKIIGLVEELSGLTPGLPVYWDAGALTQIEPNTGSTWQITVGKAISATEMLINPDLASSAIFIENNAGSSIINNNQVVPASVALLNVDNSIYKSFSVDYWVRRVFSTTGPFSDGTLDAAFTTNSSDGSKFGTGLTPEIRTIAVQSDGKILVGGEFTNYNGVVGRNRLVRLNSDGTLDTAFTTNSSDGSKFNGTIYRIVIQSTGKIIVGGNFFNYNGVSGRDYLICLNDDGTLDTAFTANSSDGSKFTNTVFGLHCQPDDKIVVGGQFIDYDGTLGRNRLIRLNDDGTLDSAFTVNSSDGNKFQNNWVVTVLGRPDGKILVGGAFSQYDSIISDRRGLVLLNSDGTLDAAFTLNASEGGKFPVASVIQSLAVFSDNSSLIGGQFINYDGTVGRNQLIKLNDDGTLDLTFTGNSSDGAKISSLVWDLEVQVDGKILVGGAFSAYDSVAGRDRLIRLNSDGTLDALFTANVSEVGKFNATVYQTKIASDGSVLAGGVFTNYEGVTGRNKLIKTASATVEDEIVEAGELRGVANVSTNTWLMNNYGVIGDAEVDFTIDSTGQVLYTSSNLPNHISGEIKFEIKTLLEN